MFTTKRFIAATVMGFATGFICFALASSSPGLLPSAVAYQIVLSRALAGFTIGISVFKMGHWSIHGAVIGAVFSLPLAFSGLMAPDNPQFDKSTMFAMTIIMGLIYGILIEFVTSVLFKAKMQAALKAI
ncbi:MAG TPA: hypothetical protein VLM39_02285 [Ignavibacteriaceae bacterium]|nr:hypothetical protein [Ignavibacteriaceae bacterium]